MSKKKINIYLISTLIIIVAILIAAFIIEYGLEYQACKLCIYERIPYIVSTLLIFITFILKKYTKNFLLILSILFFLSSILAFYHFGIEQGFFNDLSVCKSGNLLENLSKQDLLDQLKQAPVTCKEVSFRILGFSLATINMILSLAFSALYLRLFLLFKN
tara:strand:- start:1064 stop:1543 length:480 start_codon:yes stop_codon:yes gene_type:complete